MRLKHVIRGCASALAVAALSAPAAVADTPGQYIVTDFAIPGTDTIYSFTPAGVRSTITTGGNLGAVEGIVRLGSNDYVVADQGPTNTATVDGKVVRVTNGAQTVLGNGNLLVNPHALALSRDRKLLYVAERAPGRIVEITIATGAQRLVASGGGITDLRGIAVEQSGSLLVVNSGVTGALLRVNAVTGAQLPLLNGPPLTDPRGIVLRPNGDAVIGDSGGIGDGSLINVDLPSLATGTLAGGAFFGGSSVPGALAFEISGNLVVADRNSNAAGAAGRLFRVNSGGAITEVVTPASNLLSEANGVVVVPPKCGGKFATIVGSPGKDTLPGTNGADVIVALGGKDTVKGKGGKDVICGGAGNDILSGGGGKDTIIPGKGKDRVNGGAGRDTLRCSPLDPRCA